MLQLLMVLLDDRGRAMDIIIAIASVLFSALFEVLYSKYNSFKFKRMLARGQKTRKAVKEKEATNAHKARGKKFMMRAVIAYISSILLFILAVNVSENGGIFLILFLLFHIAALVFFVLGIVFLVKGRKKKQKRIGEE